MMRNPSRKCNLRAYAVIFSASTMLLLLVSFQSDSMAVRSSYKAAGDDEGKMMLGSRPPGCVNRCMNCHPCRATLVIPPHHNRHSKRASAKPTKREDDTYYLLSWKCRCGDKLYQP